MKTSKLALAVAMSCAATSVMAADAGSTEDSIEHVVVSSRIATPLRQLATSVSVVTQEEIELRGYANLAEVLRIQPSIHVTDSGGIGSTSALRIRGEEGYRTLIRIDGVDISDPTGTQVQPHVGQLQSANVSRVEILRGTQGLVYGADAGGVINIQTGRVEQGTFGSVSASAGAYNTNNIAGEVGAGTELVDGYLSVSDYSTDGFNARLDDTILQDDDGYENTTVHARVNVRPVEDLSLGFVVRNNDGEGEFDHCYSDGYVDDCQSNFKQTNFRVNANYETDSGNQQLAYSKSLVERENLTLGEQSYFTKGNIERVEYLGNTQVNAQNNVVYGIDWEEESITSSRESRTQTGYYAELQSEFTENLFTTAGVRYDDNEDFGEHVSFRLSSAYIWALEQGDLKLRGAYGTGFRAPSLYEIQYNRDFGYAPASDIDLKEETSEGYEIGLQFTPSAGTSVEVVYFDQKIEDAISFDLATYSGYLQESGTSYSDGVELIGQWAVTDAWLLKANYTYNDTEDATGAQRSRRPRQLGSLGVMYQYEALTAEANVRLVADAVDNGVKLKDYALVDVSARYSVNEHLDVFGRVENALDEDYQGASAFRSRGRAAHVGLTYAF